MRTAGDRMAREEALRRVSGGTADGRVLRMSISLAVNRASCFHWSRR